jgi:hypothetical protein
MNHLNISTRLYVENRAVFEVRRLHATFIQFAQKFRVLQATVEQILFSMSPYKTSVEEQNLPEEILQQNDDLFVAYDGTVLMKIFNVQNRLSKPYSSNDFFI